jgi:hypothetical protein
VEYHMFTCMSAAGHLCSAKYNLLCRALWYQLITALHIRSCYPQQVSLQQKWPQQHNWPHCTQFHHVRHMTAQLAPSLANNHELCACLHLLNIPVQLFRFAQVQSSPPSESRPVYRSVAALLQAEARPGDITLDFRSPTLSVKLSLPDPGRITPVDLVMEEHGSLQRARMVRTRCREWHSVVSLVLRHFVLSLVMPACTVKLHAWCAPDPVQCHSSKVPFGMY